MKKKEISDKTAKAMRSYTLEKFNKKYMMCGPEPVIYNGKEIPTQPPMIIE